jgi:hypothetical protein
VLPEWLVVLQGFQGSVLLGPHPGHCRALRRNLSQLCFYVQTSTPQAKLYRPGAGKILV